MSDRFYILEPSNFATLTTDAAFDGFNYAIDNDFIFLFGGSASADNSYCDQVMYVYDIHANTWKKKEMSLPVDIQGSAVCVHEGEIFFFGGYKCNQIRRYSPVAGEWFTTGNGYIPTSYGITMDSGLHCSRPCIIDNKAYIGGCGYAVSNARTNVFEYDFSTSEITNAKVFQNFAQNCTWLKVYPDESKFMQSMRLTSTAASVGYRYCDYAASTNVDSYTKTYTATDTMVRNIIGEMEDGTILDIRPDIDNNKRLTVKIIETKDDSNGKTYESAAEIYHEFEDPIMLSLNEVRTANNMDSRGRIFIPYFTSDAHTEIKLICIAKARYMKGTDQTIATTINNRVTEVKEVLSASIDCEAENGTDIRIALSIDDRNTYKYFTGGTWQTITDKNMVKNKEGMTPAQFAALSTDDFKLLIGSADGLNIDILVSLYTNDEGLTPKIKKISFKTSKLVI